MGNYLMLNGKRIDLTQEQIETLVGKKEKDPFKRVGEREEYYYIEYNGKVDKAFENNISTDDECHSIANYCTDKELMEQRALHETLSRLLWSYSIQHGGRDLEWNNDDLDKWSLYFNNNTGVYGVTSSQYCRLEGTAYFRTKTTAEAAIEEIVKPFMEKHPEFRW